MLLELTMTFVNESRPLFRPASSVNQRRAPGDVEAPGIGVDHRVERHHLFFERRRRRHDLEVEPGIVEILHRAVAALGFLRIAIGVRV
jgi:hypothetical protein